MYNTEQTHSIHPLHLVVDSLAVRCHRSLLERLSERWVSVTRPRNVLRRGTVLQSQRALRDHLAGVGADNVHTKKPVRLGVREHLDHAVRVQVRLGARVGAEGEGSDAVGGAGRLEFLLALADPCNLGVRVHDRWDASVVDVAVALLDVLDDGDGLLLGLVGQHGPEGDISNAPDVGELGSVLLINDDTSALVELQPNILQAQSRGVWPATYGDEDDVGVELYRTGTVGQQNLLFEGGGAPG